MNEEAPKKEGVFLGLQKKQRCKLCEHEFFVDELPGAISYKSVLVLRKSWGVPVQFLSPSLMYRQVKLCVFCTQFFSKLAEPEKKKKIKKKRQSKGTNSTKVSNTQGSIHGSVRSAKVGNK